MTAMSWFGRVWESVCSHCGYYVWFVENQWSHMTPVKYATLLITIGLVGFLMMGKGNKRT